MRVYILTEGGIERGLGHVTRCTSLCQAFREQGIKPEFIVNGDECIKHLQPCGSLRFRDWLTHREDVYSLFKGADIVIVDSYLADADLYYKVSELAKVSVYLDDYKRLAYPKGIVLNGSINAVELRYPERREITYLLGSKYIPLRKEFWDIPEKAVGQHIERILITFGGDDRRNMTPKVLRFLNEQYPEALKTVVIGSGFRNLEEIEHLQNDRVELVYSPDAEEMKTVMCASDIALSGGGQTLAELARVGVPTIAIAVADNQVNNIRGWQKAGSIEYAGWWEDKDVLENVKNSLELLRDGIIRRTISMRGRCVVDGQGARRIVQKIVDICNGLMCK
ncbi:MAG: PseG/SpsG family protein [Nitrospirota bacterium]